MKAADLIAFEAEIAQLFEAAQIRGPVHLHGGNEEPLIAIFKRVKAEDWVFSTHRSHYHALLKGVPPEMVRAEILKGNSIGMQFPEYLFYTSAIVAGCAPIALGVALAGERVWCFVGDMAAETGLFHECLKFAVGYDLPITYVIENNHYSVETPTERVWRRGAVYRTKVLQYSYERVWPHQGTGTGKWVAF